MTRVSGFETDRLILRQWGKQDLPHFAILNADPDVMEYFPKTLSEQESDNLAEKITSLIEKNGWGLWAVECKADRNFIGFVGLHNCPESLPFSPAVEIGWRLSKDYWKKGYATEAAKACLEFAFDMLKLHEVVSFTAIDNHRSRAVMERIGLRNTENNFDHPALDDDCPLQEHVLYKITRTEYKNRAD